jgi:hypothetical protein
MDLLIFFFLTKYNFVLPMPFLPNLPSSGNHCPTLCFYEFDILDLGSSLLSLGQNFLLFETEYCSLFIQHFMNIKVGATSWLLWIVLQYIYCIHTHSIHRSAGLFSVLISFALNIYPGMGLLYHMVALLLMFWITSILFSIRAALNIQ